MIRGYSLRAQERIRRHTLSRNPLHIDNRSSIRFVLFFACHVHMLTVPGSKKALASPLDMWHEFFHPSHILKFLI